jgi:hypothetical protein
MAPESEVSDFGQRLETLESGAMTPAPCRCETEGTCVYLGVRIGRKYYHGWGVGTGWV